jgi:hypothetical protein
MFRLVCRFFFIVERHYLEDAVLTGGYIILIPNTIVKNQLRPGIYTLILKITKKRKKWDSLG